MKRPIRLSASALSVLLDCPRCFWAQVNEELRRPQGPFPSLPGGMDSVLKTFMDGHRKRGTMPAELHGVTTAQLFPDQKQLDRWRDALRGDLRYADQSLGVEVVGGIDDLLVEPGGALTPLDFKTRGWPVKDDTHHHYQHQLDLYVWLFQRLGQRVSGKGILLFFSPVAYEGDGHTTFRVEPVVMETDVVRAEELLKRAVRVLQGPLPKEHGDCAFCHFVGRRGVLED